MRVVWIMCSSQAEAFEASPKQRWRWMWMELEPAFFAHRRGGCMTIGQDKVRALDFLPLVVDTVLVLRPTVT